ncbi:hypothetical protein LR48_Vigan03g150200 [Vigna angularis]|uniref:Secreted protein n=2 Tax=Phaseolus angularis TaxID=3914 RepID=A0A0L9U5R7_PHAAN|nr:hypothetical protein LR48_Vigan03g150200 [Vigna angularis]BAT84544.1 hypothetical protein VIGAN_04195200 [Vigna angularis var. angularis]
MGPSICQLLFVIFYIDHGCSFSSWMSRCTSFSFRCTVNCPWTLQYVCVAGCCCNKSFFINHHGAYCWMLLHMNTTSAAVFLCGVALSFPAGGCFNKVLDRLLQAAGRDSTISACGLLLPAPLLQACCTVSPTVTAAACWSCLELDVVGEDNCWCRP